MEYERQMKKIDKYFQNLTKNPNYLRIGAKNKTFYSKKIVFYVHIVDKKEDIGMEKGQIMGPYNAKTAEIVMTEMLQKGLCCWIEQSAIR